jgi:hypothetical protein
LVLFNRFCQPDFDLENLEVVPNFLLSTSHELLRGLNWVAVLFGHTRGDLAITARRGCLSAPTRRFSGLWSNIGGRSSAS